MNKLLVKVIILFTSLFASQTLYGSENNYTIEDVRIEAVNEDLNLARNLAIEEGEEKAFSLLLSNLNITAPNITHNEILDLITNSILKNEVTQGNLYQASLTLSFDGDKLLSKTADVDLPTENLLVKVSNYEDWLRIKHNLTKVLAKERLNIYEISNHLVTIKLQKNEMLLLESEVGKIDLVLEKHPDSLIIYSISQTI